MKKVLAIGLGIALSFGVASAQNKKAPARKKPAAAKKNPKTDPKPAATQPDAPADPIPPATPVTTPAQAAPAATPPLATPAAPAAGTKGTTAPLASKPAGTPAAKPGPMPKTSEKPGTQLDRRGGSGDYRSVAEADERAAEMAFREGNERLNDGLFVKAVESYRKALVRWDHPAIHYNLALALINLDQPIEVHEHMTKALQYGADPLEKDKYDHGREYLRLVEGQLADIEVSCDKVGAKVSVDGKQVFVAPGRYAAKVRVGKHTFFADKEGYNARVEAPFVGAGETFRINLKVYTTPELTRYTRKWDRAWVPYAVMGGGALVALGGALFQLSAQTSYDRYNNLVASCNRTAQGCSTDPNNPELAEINKARDSGDSKRLMGYIGYGVGGAAVATGIVLAYMNRSRPYQITPEQLEGQRASSPASIAIVPVVSPEAVGATVQGHF
jgi:hypothetical protein